MTTSSERTYPPKKLVPVDESILVIMYKAPTPGKPFTKKVKDKDGNLVEKTISQVNFHFRIADSSHSELCGQPHILTATDFISAGDGTKSASKVHTLLTVMGGQELAAGLSGKYVFDSKDPAKLVPPEVWEPLVEQFYGATFSAPKLDDAGNMRLGDNGSPYQTVAEIKTLKSLRWKLEDCKLWPPPRPELGLPNGKTGQAPPIEPPKDEPKEPQTYMLRRTFGTQADMIGELKALVKSHADFAKLKDQFLALKGAPLVGNLCEDDVKHLLVLFWLEEHRANGGIVSAKIGAECMTKHKALYRLEPAEAIFLLAASDHEATLDKQF
ncbi:MAG: hypothetical protein JWN15_4454 [Firmicutes bacterium]|nr:hypothetical protein [Bacillota bacterium]